ncbi:MAG: hypothetical protein OXF23_05205 [Candidatus Dadabacteria bacterium]|nr:hypothetical protein [Candidatus Dadabacteria bacterium]
MLELKRKGSELVGPCPSCGGTDRFHVRREGQRAIVGCRGCIDGGGTGFSAVLRAAFPERFDRPVESRLAPSPVQSIDQEQRRIRERESAAKKVQGRMKQCEFAQHDYLASKGFQDHMALVSGNGWMMIPISNDADKVRSAQYISSEGEKLFQPKGEIKGNFYRLGRNRRRGRNSEIWLVEGYATALSVRAALRLRLRSYSPEIRICFSAQNLSIVGKDAIEKGHTIFAVPDHDRWTCRNKHRWDGSLTESTCPECGTTQTTPPAGEYYAAMLKRPYWMPPDVGFDANDFHQKYGLDALASELVAFRFD